MYYAIVNNQIIIAELEETLTAYYQNVAELPADYETDKYRVQDDMLVINPDYEKQKAEEEAKRIANLKLTAADVERGIYQAKGLDFEDIIAMIEANPPQGLDVKRLKIELKANHFYRGNPYVESVGKMLGFTDKQLTRFFETNDYKELLNENPTDKQPTIPDEVPAQGV